MSDWRTWTVASPPRTKRETAEWIVGVCDAWMETGEIPSGGAADLNWCRSRLTEARGWLDGETRKAAK